MKIAPTELSDVLLVDPDVYADHRGFFMESWNQERYAAAGLAMDVVQTNLSRSEGSVLRGLHYQWRRPQGKLVSVVEGAIFDVAVDIRRGSPTFGRWVGRRLDDDKRRQLYVPPGFAHGFCSLTEVVVVAYACTTAYDPESDANVSWRDPAIAVDWPVESPQVSERDAAAPLLADIPSDRLPAYASAS